MYALTLASLLTVAPLAAPRAPDPTGALEQLEAEVRGHLDAKRADLAVEAAERLATAAAGAPDPRRAVALEVATRAQRTAHRYTRAAELAAQVAALRRAAWDKEHTHARAEEAADALRASGELLELLGRTPEAARRYEDALGVQDAAGVSTGAVRFDLLWSSGRLLVISGDVERALGRLRAALKIASDPHARARADTSLGMLLLAGGRFKDAAHHLTSAGAYYAARTRDPVNVMSRVEGTEQVLVFIAAAHFLRRAGKPADAEANLERHLKNLPGLVRVELEGLVRDELGRTKLALGKLAAAEEQLERAAITSQPAGVVLALLRGTAGTGRNEALAALRARVQAEVRHLSDGFAYQSERQRLVATTTARGVVDAYVTVALAAGTPAAELYEVVSAWKGAVFARSLADAVATAAPAPDRPAPPDVAHRFRRLSDLRAQLADAGAEARFLRERGEPDAAALRGVAERRERLEQEFSELAAAALGAEATRPAVRPAEIAAALPRGTALVEYFVYEHYLPPAPNAPLPADGTYFRREGRVLAFVVRADGAVAAVPLKLPAPALVGLVREWLALLPQWNDAGTGPHPDLRARGADLARAVWEPLRPHLEGIGPLVLAPDAFLWRLPFAALPGTGVDRYLIQEHPLAYALSGRHARSLFRPPAAPNPRATDGCLVVADPEYGPVNPTRAEDRPALDPDPSWLQYIERAAGSAYAARPPKVLTGREADGPRVLDGLRGGYREAILFAHGPVTVRRVNRDLLPGADFEGVPLVTPNLVAAFGSVHLPLAGSNGQEPGSAHAPTPDDWLAPDLVVPELVWFWGCDTVAGPLLPSEGPIGFTRALLVGGARCVVTSFGTVTTASARRFSRLAHALSWERRAGPGLAVRSVQLHYLRAGGRSAHPAYWAPWLVIGDVRSFDQPALEIDAAFEAKALADEPPLGPPPPVTAAAPTRSGIWVFGLVGIGLTVGVGWFVWRRRGRVRA